MKRIGKNTNETGEAVTNVVSVDSTTTATLLPALVFTDRPYMEVNVTNDGNKALWVKKQAASVDNDKKGVRVIPGETAPIIKQGEVYRGEISAIFDSGGSRDVIVEWF